MTQRPPFHRHIGGIHWFSLGRWRISLCRTGHQPPVATQPKRPRGTDGASLRQLQPSPIHLPHINSGPRPTVDGLMAMSRES